MRARAVLCVLSVAFGTTPALAQDAPPCGPAGPMLASLLTQYGEVPAYQAASSGGSPMAVLVNPDTGSWTMLYMPQPGLACMVATGNDWTTLPAPLPGDPT